LLLTHLDSFRRFNRSTACLFKEFCPGAYTLLSLSLGERVVHLPVASILKDLVGLRFNSLRTLTGAFCSGGSGRRHLRDLDLGSLTRCFNPALGFTGLLKRTSTL
jgi:hypothetical protein